MKPKYSICIPNFNMEDTINEALRSVLNQLDNRFEVIVVDDGSSDNSLEILLELAKEFPIMKVFSLERNRKRTLAETRNFSVFQSKGQYLILHIDCDDYWHPYLLDFVKVFHLLESELKHPFLMSGYQFHMGESNFLKSQGPYQYGHMVEDRDLWYRMAKMGRWIPIDHVVFRERLPISLKKRLYKYFILTVRIVSDEIRTGNTFAVYLKGLINQSANLSLIYRFYKVLVFPISFIRAKYLGKINIESRDDWNLLKTESWEKSGTILDFFEKRGKKVNLSELTIDGQWIFSNSSKSHTISELKNLK